MKKILSVLFCLVLLLGFTPQAHANGNRPVTFGRNFSQFQGGHHYNRGYYAQPFTYSYPVQSFYVQPQATFYQPVQTQVFQAPLAAPCPQQQFVPQLAPQPTYSPPQLELAPALCPTAGFQGYSGPVSNYGIGYQQGFRGYQRNFNHFHYRR